MLVAVVSLSEALIFQHPDRMSDSLTEQYLQSLLYACCYHSYPVRKYGQASVKKIVAGLGGLSLALIMSRLLNKLLDLQNWTEVSDIRCYAHLDLLFGCYYFYNSESSRGLVNSLLGICCSSSNG